MQILKQIKKVFEGGCKVCVPYCDNENDDQAQSDKKE
jgi:hypothetical protein